MRTVLASLVELSLLRYLGTIALVQARAYRLRQPLLLWRRRRRAAGFEARLAARWRAGLDLYETAPVLACDAGARFNDRHRARAAEMNDLAFEVLTHLHARACRTASEVLALLKAGHATGAHARWRTLHEIAVIAFFIQEHGREVAERYALHGAIEFHKAAVQYQEHCAALGYDAFTDAEMAEFKRRRDALCARFGPEYAEEYGWAAGATAARPIRFATLEAAVATRHQRPFYRMASHAVHGGPKGTFWSVEDSDHRRVLLGGPTNAGLADPGHGALIALMQATVALLTSRPSARDLVTLTALGHLVDRAGDAFLAAHEKLRAEEAALAAGRVPR